MAISLSNLISFFILTIIVFVSFLPCSLCRSLVSSLPHSQILDVSKSIQNTLQVLSPNLKSLQQQEAIKQQQQPLYSSSSSSAFSVSIYPRSSLVKPQHRDYTSLTLSRLARDTARVSSLTAMLQLSPTNFTYSDLKSVRTMSGPEEFQTPVTSGSSEGSGEYFARLGVGEPAKEFYMAIDTGSDINWLQCEPCSECYQQTDPIFNPSDSSTYNPVSCDSPECSALDASSCYVDTCMYQVSYGDGSYTEGELATETVSFGNSGSFSNVVIGCGHDNEGLFTGSAGLLGLGGGSLSLPSQVKATSFSYCLVDSDSDSSSTLEFNSAGPNDSVFAPLLRNSKRDTFFYIGLEGISVGGEMLQVPASIFQVDDNGRGGIIVDSGTAVTRLQSRVYDALRDTFVKYAQNLPSSDRFELFDTCFDLSSMRRASVPTVAFHFSGGKTLPLHAQNTLVPIDSSGKYCLAFAPTDESLSIIGNVQQQGTRVSYDLTNNLVGFSRDKC
ncbi:protein ASPARTIC PROTEASE IN GUARD CELL 1-like [Solanum dulcamara]|uniref:protein ASPARTIC PROTEASE IN GUARD CELL 1-like n=1 Tax=Solanum dulcamara TaxID=45834 RepID=UPI00248617DB|nr:protein ASPARTIC PROTEASE IN GUARD CELL 1-like [Solanum dulcamara]